MRMTMETVDHLAELSMLTFTGQEKIQLRDELENMLRLIEPLKDVDTSGVEPLIHMTEEPHPREDKVREQMERQAVFLNSENHSDYFFRTPPAIKR